MGVCIVSKEVLEALRSLKDATAHMVYICKYILI
jgi:hypothetical protein